MGGGLKFFARKEGGEAKWEGWSRNRAGVILY